MDIWRILPIAQFLIGIQGNDNPNPCYMDMFPKKLGYGDESYRDHCFFEVPEEDQNFVNEIIQEKNAEGGTDLYYWYIKKKADKTCRKYKSRLPQLTDGHILKFFEWVMSRNYLVRHIPEDHAVGDSYRKVSLQWDNGMYFHEMPHKKIFKTDVSFEYDIVKNTFGIYFTGPQPYFWAHRNPPQSKNDRVNRALLVICHWNESDLFRKTTKVPPKTSPPKGTEPKDQLDYVDGQGINLGPPMAAMVIAMTIFIWIRMY